MNRTQPKYYRQRFLLVLLQMAGGSLSRMDFQKLLFLSQQKAGFSYFDFVPYSYGCYSFQAQSDIELLASAGWLKEGPKNIKLLKDADVALKDNEKYSIEAFTRNFKNLRGRKLLTYVYESYPYYAVRSKIASDVLNSEAYNRVVTEKNKLQVRGRVIYTIGYEGMLFESYVNNLIKHDVRLVCDVRKNPISRKFGFSKGALSKLLPKLGIEYKHLPELGIPSYMRKSLNSPDDYAALFEIYRKSLSNQQQSLDLVANLLKEYDRIALTCFEKSYYYCHRHCISDNINAQKGYKVCHL